MYTKSRDSGGFGKNRITVYLQRKIDFAQKSIVSPQDSKICKQAPREVGAAGAAPGPIRV